jgi:hypothetical protein
MLHIVAIGWLWVTLMMAITEKSIVAGVLTFVFYGLLPCGVTLYVLGTPGRRRRALREQAASQAEGGEPESAPSADDAASET